MTVNMYWSYQRLLSFLAAITTLFLLASGDCVFDVNQQIVNEPLLLQSFDNNSYELFLYKECSLKIKTNQDLLLTCPGRQNYLNLTNSDWNVAKCVQRNDLQINGNLIQYGRVGCKNRPQASLKISGKQCFKNNGVVIRIGFEVKNNWYPLLEVCHNIQKGQTYHVKHNIILPSSHCIKTPNSRPGFSEGDARLYSGLNMDHTYTTRYQHTLLKRMIGTNATNYIDLNEYKFLARGHLAPDADFPMDAWHSLTYFYINTAPQWQSINGGSWESLENKVRKIFTVTKQLDVITGTHGIMKIDGKQFYLGNGKVPVPEYFWKLIHNPADDSCMGFIAKNNPFLKRQPHRICEDVCHRYNWKFSNHNLFNGYVYCCEYHHLSKVIEEVPTVRCRSALRYPQSH